MTKIGMRNAWFQVHKWIGLILAILIIPLCVTGSALVWDEALDHALNPQRYATSGAGALDPQRYVDAAKAALKPGETISGYTHEAGGPVVIVANQASATARPGPPARTFVWLDPPTARVLDVGRGGGLVRTMHNIHGSLMVPGVGRQIVGWIGVAMLVSSISGLWLWWPTVGRWARGLRWKRHRNTDTNLHHLLGFWIALPLFVLSLTGAWISFPQVFGGGPGGGMGGPPRGGARPVPLAVTKLSVGAAIAAARTVSPGEIGQITWPTNQKPEWKLALADTQASVTVDDTTGVAKAGRPERETLARTMRRIHDGTRMGLVWQVIIFLGGILPAILAVTGIIMWWRARGWKAALRARQAARAG